LPGCEAQTIRGRSQPVFPPHESMSMTELLSAPSCSCAAAPTTTATEGAATDGPIAIYGATDRFNYGDLLFPLVIRWAIERSGDARKPLNIAIRDSDLSDYGAVPTVAMQRALAEDMLVGYRRLVVAGGQVLDARWTAIVAYLNGKTTNFAIRALRKSIGEPFTDSLTRRLAGVPWPQPFVVPTADIPKNVEIAYNAVGGAEIELLRPGYLDSLRSALERASYISVRDNATFDALRRMGVPADLTPDSATVMSQAFGRTELDARCSATHRQQLSEAGANYLVFQIGQNFVRGREHEIANTLCAAARAQGLTIVLLAIGTAAGHEDQIALSRIQRYIPRELAPVALFGGTVVEIMATIAGSRLYVGTSLHGAITAMSFGVPRLAFTLEVGKLTEYLRTWDLEEYAMCLPTGGSLKLISNALGVSLERRTRLAEALGARALQGLALAVGQDATRHSSRS